MEEPRKPIKIVIKKASENRSFQRDIFKFHMIFSQSPKQTLNKMQSWPK